MSKIGDLKIKVTPELDDAKLRAQLAALSNKDLKIPAQVDVKQDEIGRELAKKPIHIPAEVDIDQNQLGRALAGKKIHIPAEVDINQDPFKAMLRGIGSDIGTLVKRDLGNLSSAFTSVGSTAAGAFSEVGSVLGKVGGLLGTLVQAGAISLLIAEGGAAITVAWGAASTAIAAVPAAIGLIGAPLAAVLLGMDGIKKAAAVLTPEFNKLKAAVSSTFQSQLVPVFNQLKGVMTALTPQIQAVATSMVGLAQQTANWVTNAGGLQLIQTAFSNIAAAVGNINIVPLVDGFVRLAGNAAALKALTTTINQLGLEVQKIAGMGPVLDQAFSGLEGVLKSLTTAFGDLVRNGIETFAAAAPGAQAAIEGIGTFFNKFDWTRLGAAAGGALRGIGDAVKSIPPSTVEAITTSFEGLSTQLNSPGFKQAIQDIAANIPAAVTVIGNLATGFTKLTATALKVNSGLVSAGQAFVNFRGTVQQFLGLIPSDAERSLSNLPTVIQQKLNLVPPIFKAAGTAASNGFVGAVQPMPGLMGKVTEQITQQATTGLTGLVTGATAIGAKVPPAILTPIEILAQKIPVPARAVGEAFGTNTSSSILAGLAQASSSVDQGFVPLAGAATTGTTSMVDAVNAVLPGVGTAFQTAFTSLQTLATAAFTDLNTQFTAFGTTLTTFGQAFTTITPQITAFGTAFTTLNPALLAFNTAFTTLNPALLAFGTSFTTIIPQITAFGTAFTTLNPAMLAFTTAFTTLNPALVAFGATFATIIPQITAFGTAFTTLNPQLLAFATAFTTLNPALLAFGTSLTTINPALLAFGTSLTTINPALLVFGTSLTTINPALLAFGTSLTTINPALVAFAATLATIAPALTGFGTGLTAAVASLTTFTTALTTATTAVTTFATTVTTAVTTAMTAMTTAVTEASNQMVQSMTTAMTGITTAVQNGMNQSVAAVKTGVAAIIAALNAAAGPAKTAGVNLGKGFVEGIKSQEGAARAAGAALGQAAVDGMNSVKGISSASPSKKGIKSGVFLGLGFTKGIDRMQSDARLAGANLGAIAADATQTEFDSRFADIARTFGTELTSKLQAELSSGFDSSGSSSVPVILHNVFQIGSEAIEEIFHTLNEVDKADLLLKLRAG